jgi:uncharacterized protein
MSADVASINADPLFWLAAGLAVACLGLAKGGFIGFGLIATPLLALAVSPVEAVAILLPIMLAQDYLSGWAYRREWDGSTLSVTLPGAAVGIGLAWLSAAFFSTGLLRLTIGVIALYLALSRWLGSAAKSDPSARFGVMCGVVSGFTGTLANAGGPPFLLYVLPQQFAKMTFVGTMALFFAGINTMKIAPYMALGQFSTRNLVTSAMLLPCAVATNLIGIRLVRVLPTDAFYRVAYILIFFMSLALMWQGATALWEN